MRQLSRIATHQNISRFTHILPALRIASTMLLITNMKLAKNTIHTPIVNKDSIILVPTNIDFIQPVVVEDVKEVKYFEEQYAIWLERNDYNHLAYSQY